MNCQNFESIVNELTRQQMTEANVREQALAHAGECGVCALRLEDQRALTQKLRAVSGEMNEMHAPARIETELRAAFRRHKFAEPRRSAIYDSRYWATAAAALLLIVIGIVAISMRTRPVPVAADKPHIPASQPIRDNANNAAGPSNSIHKPKPITSPSKRNTLASRNPKRYENSLAARSNSAGGRSETNALAADSEASVTADFSGDEIATDFLPLGYGSPMNLEDGGQVMRVELPRSALAGFGLPVNIERINERVTADVLMGPDGQARAIRFVQ